MSYLLLSGRFLGEAHGTVHLGNSEAQPPAFGEEHRQLEESECFTTLIMIDAYGDGWDGAEFTWTDQASGAVVGSGTLEAGASGTAPLCGIGCHRLEVSDGDFPNELSWKVNDDAGVEQASGALPL